ncbi:MAG: putative 2-hydroxyacid dehydrogenase [Firmicutes bacterium ADurb.Bin506]|jgi:D-3-phosphoglycerate dehydrogenase|nr:MAG: putative 2-hydroxyacid dehydrogenase [Firmicutes bacterium ADurb.Bin506]
MTWKVLVTPRTFGKTDPVPREMLIKAGCEVVPNPFGRMLTEDELISLGGDVDGIIGGLDPFTRRVMENCRNLKAISRYGVGVNNVDLEYASARGIMVTNTPGANSAAVAELAIALIMAAARKVCCSDRAIRQGVWKQYHGMQLSGKTIGIVGTGQIGRETAELARGLRMKVLCNDIMPNRDWASAIGAEYVKLERLIRESDYVSVHVPYNEDTHHLISSEQFASMKQSAIVVNTARGGIIDETALCEALASGRIAGAALDVFETEPPSGSPLLAMDNVVLTSHIGAHTQEAVENMGRMAAQNLIMCLSGATPANVVTN